MILSVSGCSDKYYSEGDYSSVLKIDSHFHINSDKGYFEDAEKQDKFILITLGVDHGDSANIRMQQDDAILSVTKFPGRVFYGSTFHFDTSEWKTDNWSKKVITQLDKDISDGAIMRMWRKFSGIIARKPM